MLQSLLSLIRDRILPKFTHIKTSLECDYCAIATKKVEYEASSRESINRILAQSGMTEDELAAN
ncbi:hypothetical protein [Trichocoleus sp. DQ-U1]|uniref:hypothetical protein n=1 Tax=Trichocoleus sp. DQ-U1 TaxID=2933926 RepID=UPI003299755D